MYCIPQSQLRDHTLVARAVSSGIWAEVSRSQGGGTVNVAGLLLRPTLVSGLLPLIAARIISEAERRHAEEAPEAALKEALEKARQVAVAQAFAAAGAKAKASMTQPMTGIIALDNFNGSRRHLRVSPHRRL